MNGIYSEVQARFREVNKLAEWVPCAAHSLNLVESVIVECYTKAIKFFSGIQLIYSFLSASPQRWSMILKNMKKSVYVVKSSSKTRWSAARRSDAMNRNVNHLIMKESVRH